ncbi:MAG: NnrU family protein [Pseudomonadota bacterium]
MTLLILGIALWWGAHLFKRLAPEARAAMTARLGDGSKGVFALLILAAVVLMVLGYRAAAFTPVWYPPPAMVHANNLLMLAAVALFGMGSSKGRARAWLRHPMLTGFAVWCIAHLLVNGDLASLILWGALLVWVPVEIAVINRAEGAWIRPEPGPAAGDLRWLGISAGVFAVIGTAHWLLGVWPFPGAVA